MKILATADLHIGRKASQVPKGLKFASCAEVWNKIVDLALEREVDAVLLAGDILDEKNKFYEALGPLEQGVLKLTRAGVQVVAVAGNHDFSILPQIADSVGKDKFQLLGRGGKWEKVLIHSRDRGEALQVFGWSFPARYVGVSPLGAFPKEEVETHTPVVGVLHADLEGAAHYCPVDSSEFNGTGVPVWVLGHIHKPSDINPDAVQMAVYPGSPQGLDPGEAGVHGVLLLHVQGDKITPERLPLGPIVYESFDFPVQALSVEELNPAMSDFLKGKVAKLNQAGQLKVVSVRLNISGRSALKEDVITEQLKGLLEGDLIIGEVSVWVSRFTISVRPELNLEDLSKSKGFDGCLANLIIALQNDSLDTKHKELLAAVQKSTSSFYSESVFNYLADNNKPGEGECKSMLLEQAWKLLGALVELKAPGVVHE